MASILPDIGGAWRSFWHTMTSYDRHASHNSPYRTGQHVPLAQSRHTTLTSVATDATESQTQLANSAQEPPSDANGYFQHTDSPSSGAPYSPGMRTVLQRRQSEDSISKKAAKTSAGEIQMQNFSDGLPPPPPVGHSWKRIDRWCEDSYEELFDNICEGCTQNDINELEHELDCTLPMDVHESLKIHDGQERGGLPTGLLFGCMLLDCEDIVQEWRNWRIVSEDILARPPANFQPSPIEASVASSSNTKDAYSYPSSSTAPQTRSLPNPQWRDELQSRQDSQPSNAVQKVYAHPAWIPLAKDWGGNCIAVDLAPGPSGKWGQIIIMGRDYDCKYVVARSWAAFMAMVADDINSQNVDVNEESGDMKLLEFKNQNVEPPYLDILRWRSDQKYGRKPPKRRLTGDIRVNPSAPGTSSASGPGRASPYASPVRTNGDRDGSPQRMPMHRKGSGVNSPRGAISSPLARVAEEAPILSTDSLPAAEILPGKDSSPHEPLMGTESTATSESMDTANTETASTTRTSISSNHNASNKENIPATSTSLLSAKVDGLGMQNVPLDSSVEADANEMKTVEL